MTTRRKVLSVVATGGVVGISGCLGSISGSRDEAVTHAEAAADDIDKAVDEFESEAARFDNLESGEGVDVRTKVIEAHLDAASQDLDAAEQDASSDQQDGIDAFRSLVELLRRATAGLDKFADGFSKIQLAISQNQDGRYTDAADQAVEAQSPLEQARDSFTTAQASVDQIDEADIEDTDASLAEIRLELEEVTVLTETMIEFADGFVDLSEGLADLETATDRVDAERYAAAGRAAESASNHFAGAADTFKNLESSAPSRLQSEVVDLTCRAESLRDGAGHYRAGCASADLGAFDHARSEFRAAERDFDRCS